MTELDTKKPLTKIETKEGVYFSEFSLEVVKSVWKKKEGLPVGNIVLPYNVYETTISEADIADRYLYFSLPLVAKDHPDIAKKLRLRLRSMSKREREDLTYAGIRGWVEREKQEKQYFNP